MISTAHAPRLAVRIGQSTFVISSETPLPKTREDQMRGAVPSILDEGKHGRRSEAPKASACTPARWPASTAA